MMNNQETDFPEQRTVPGTGHAPSTPSLGAMLFAARESKGWTVEQVSHYLKLAPRQVEAIESDNLAVLPAPAVTRGFIRAYAKLLSVDVTPYMGHLAATAGTAQTSRTSRQPLATPFKEGRLALSGRKGLAGLPVWLIAAVGLMVVAIALVAVWQSQRGERPNATPSVAASVEVLPPNQPDGPVAGSVVSKEPSSEASAVSANSSDATAANASSPASTGPAASPAGLTTDVTDPAGPAAAMSSASSGNLLELVMNKDSWLEVRRVDTKEIVASRLVKAGTIETFEINAPVALKVGNASGVQATFRGAPLDLRASATNNVARLTLK